MPEIIPGKNNGQKPRWMLMLAIIFFILLLLVLAGLAVFNEVYKNKIYPNVFVGGFNLGGKSTEQAKTLINRQVDKINQQGIIFSYKGRKTVIIPVVYSADGSLAYQIINFNAEQMVAAAYNYGKKQDFLTNWKNKLLVLTRKKQLLLPVLVNQEKIIKILENNFPDAFDPAQDAGLAIKKNSATGDYEFSLTKEKTGKAIDYEKAIGLLVSNLSNLNLAPITLTTVTEYPKILTKDCLNVESKAKKILDFAPLILKYGDNKWAIDKDGLSRFLTLKIDNSQSDRIKVGLADDEFKAYLAQEIAPAINKEPIEAKFAISQERVTEFQDGQDGLALNLESSFLEIQNQISAISASDLPAPKDRAVEIELIARVLPVLMNTGNINNFGIKEVIGIGTSNFAGSPANRRHNIKIGSDAINGLLIRPGEEFSLLKALGKVDGSSGYLPELVIKENKTTPEFGGGLCQVGTTMFRAALETGLPITMRRNHSYRVVYYEPAGTDATIYDPWPDLRFVNDMPTYILIQTKIATNTLTFEFWGTRDGRLVEKTKSTIYNIVKPEPTKIVETLDLKPGEKKCTESAHNGADAYFDYKVSYPDGTAKEKRFSSHYVPWQEVCLLGVEKLSAPPASPAGDPGAAASSTPAN